MHEIITLQLGERSNYLATHFWNAQESYFTYSAGEESPIDHNVHFRAGIGTDGRETFTPRTLIYDFNSAFGSMRQINELYETNEAGRSDTIWDGVTMIHKQPEIQPSSYQLCLDEGVEPPTLTTETVRFWSDFNRVYYHPKSIIKLGDNQPHTNQLPFTDWNAGDELFRLIDGEDDVLDRDFRPFAEECNLLQGITIIAGVDEIWGGFTARYLDRLRDEFGRVSIWVWAMEDGRLTQKDTQRQHYVNTAKSINDISNQASLYIPMADPPSQLPVSITLDQKSKWHTSALLSASMETMTTFSRLKAGDGNRSTLDDFETFLNTSGNQRIANLRMKVKDTDDCLNSQPRSDRGQPRERRGHGTYGEQEHRSSAANYQGFDIDLFPETWGSTRWSSKSNHIFSQIEAIRGSSAVQTSRLNSDVSRMKRYQVGLRYPLPDSFPTILTSSSTESGGLLVHSALSMETGTGERVRTLQSKVQRAIELDERETLLNGLSEISEAFQHGWDSSGASDDDDF